MPIQYLPVIIRCCFFVSKLLLILFQEFFLLAFILVCLFVCLFVVLYMFSNFQGSQYIHVHVCGRNLWLKCIVLPHFITASGCIAMGLSVSCSKVISNRNNKDAKCGYWHLATTLSNTCLAAFLPLVIHDFGIYDILRKYFV